jgi:hypothetical protein
VKTHSSASAIWLPKSHPQEKRALCDWRRCRKRQARRSCGGQCQWPAEHICFGVRLWGEPRDLCWDSRDCAEREAHFECGAGRCSLTEIHAGSSIEAPERYAVLPRRPTVNAELCRRLRHHVSAQFDAVGVCGLRGSQRMPLTQWHTRRRRPQRSDLGSDVRVECPRDRAGDHLP